jgi:carbon storage regulator CsrA
MLIIERTLGSVIRIGSDIRIKVHAIPGSRRVRLGLEVPGGTLIWREELGQPNNAKPAAAPKKQLNVLIVEDDAAHAHLIQKGFKMAGSISSQWVGSAEEAMDYLRDAAGTDREPNLITLDLDLGLGNLDGVELLQQIRAEEHYALLPVVMLSGAASGRDVTAAMTAGANAFLNKTDDYGEFCNLVIRAAEFWRQAQPSTQVPAE